MKYATVLGIFLLFAVVLSLYFLPFVTYYRIESAIATKDGDEFAAHVDMDTLRRNLKAQKGQRMIWKLKKDDRQDRTLTDIAIEWSGLTRDPDIDDAISAKGFFVTLWGTDKRGRDPIKPPASLNPYDMARKLVADATFHYGSMSKFVVNVKDYKGRYIQYLSFEFSRNGFEWRLTNVSLPLY